MTSTHTCPCGSGRRYDACCGPYIGGTAWPPTAETLMRSRYTAYVLKDERYLLSTWHSSTRPQQLQLENESSVKWLGLKVVATHAGMTGDAEGTVEFVARYKINGRAHRLHEVSRFIKERGKWYYVAGDIR